MTQDKTRDDLRGLTTRLIALCLAMVVAGFVLPSPGTSATRPKQNPQAKPSLYQPMKQPGPPADLIVPSLGIRSRIVPIQVVGAAAILGDEAVEPDVAVQPPFRLRHDSSLPQARGDFDPMWAALAEADQVCAEDRERVIAAGGLHIVGTERHEARRIDNQLRGRAGRQGDPGSSRFFLSLEDDLMRIFGSDRISGLMQKLGMEEGVPIEHGMVTRAIERAQKQVEAQNFSVRKHLLEYDDVMNKQRESVYTLRREILEGKVHLSEDEIVDTHAYVLALAEDILEDQIEDRRRRIATQLDRIEDLNAEFDGPGRITIERQCRFQRRQGFAPPCRIISTFVFKRTSTCVAIRFHGSSIPP